MNTQEITQLFKDFLREVEDVTPPVVMKQLLSSKADELADKLTNFGFKVFNESLYQKAKIASLELKIKTQKDDINFLQEKNREAVEKIGELSENKNMTIKLALFYLRKAMKNKGFDEIDFDADGDNSYKTYKIESFDSGEEFTFYTLHDFADFLNS